MSPSHSRLSPSTLSDDDIVSLFLRVPPDDPALLVRTSLVCKDWRRILTGPEFCRFYREFHGTPPMLGFVLRCWSRGSDYVSRFIPTTTFRLLAGLDFYPHNWKALDSHHGRILVELVEDGGVGPSGYFVWDPITNGRWGVPSPGIVSRSWTAAVLCAKDHLGCHGPPFLVAMVASSCVYSSESGVWSEIITLEHPDRMDSDGRSILVGNTLHFSFSHYSVLQYKLDEQKLSVIDVPDKNWGNESLLFISAKDDVLVFAGWRRTSLSLWSTEPGALAWTQSKVINLDKLLPPRAFEPKRHFCIEYPPYVSGFAQGAVFLSTMAGLFAVELNSGRTKKVAEVEMACKVIPG